MTTMYLRDGSQVEVIQKLADGTYLVSIILESADWEGEPVYTQGPLSIVPEVFTGPPTAVWDREIVAMKAKAQALHEEITEARRELNQMERENKERLAKLKRLEPLRYLEEFIDGKITHFVVTPKYGLPDIKTMDDFKTTDNYWRRKRPFRLISLYGASDGDLGWAVNQYTDASGEWSEIVPCMSYEEAVRALEKILLAQLETQCTKNRLDLADKYGIYVSPKYRDIVREQALQAAASHVEKARKELAEVEAKYAALEEAE